MKFFLNSLYLPQLSAFSQWAIPTQLHAENTLDRLYEVPLHGSSCDGNSPLFKKTEIFVKQPNYNVALVAGRARQENPSEGKFFIQGIKIY
ncbi:MAG: hypothetical protein ABL895_15320 [Cyclobacteriaceae bacterium]